MSVKLTKEALYQEVEGMIGKKIADIRDEMRAEAQKERTEYMSKILSGQPNEKSTWRKEAPGTSFARLIRCWAAAKGNQGQAVDLAKKIGDPSVVKALQEATGSAGGYMVSPDMAEDVIEALRSESVLRKAGVLQVPMNKGSLAMPFISTGATAAYVGEGSNISKSDAAFGQMQLSAKKLAVVSPISNDLLKDADYRVDDIVRNDVVAAMAEREDAAFIRDIGSSNTPKGMRYWAVAGNVLNETNVATGTGNATLAEINNDLGKAIQYLMDAKVKLRKPFWAFAPRVWKKLYTLLDSNGHPIYQGEMKDGKLFGYPFFVSQQIPVNLTAPVTSSTEVYFAEGTGCMIADSNEIEIAAFDSAAYHDGSNVISAVSQDQSVIRAISRHDFGCRYRGNEVVVLLTSWGG